MERKVRVEENARRMERERKRTLLNETSEKKKDEEPSARNIEILS